MDYRKWLDSEFIIIENRVEKGLSDHISQLAKEGIGHHLILQDSVNVGLKVYINEITRIVDELGKLDFLKCKELDRIKEELYENTDKEFLHICEYCLVKKDLSENKKTFKHILDNINSIIEYRIERLKYLKKQIKRNKWWEIVKMIFSGIIGSILTLIFKKIFP